MMVTELIDKHNCGKDKRCSIYMHYYTTIYGILESQSDSLITQINSKKYSDHKVQASHIQSLFIDFILCYF